MKLKKALLFLLPIIIILFFFFPVSFDTASVKNLNNGKVTVVGHSGLGFFSWIPFNPNPSNSYASLSKAIDEYKSDGVEVDVQMTSDGEFVLYHDEKLDSKTDFTGCIANYTLAEVSEARYQLGAPFDWFQNEGLISLEKLISFLKKQEDFPILHLDVRNKSACFTVEENAEWEEKVAKNLIALLKEQNVPKEKVTMISLSFEFTSHLLRMESPYPISFEIVGNFEQNYEWVKNMGIKSVTIKPKLLTKELSARIHQDGLQVITFGAKSKSGNKKLLELNPDVIQTNNIKALRELLGYE